MEDNDSDAKVKSQNLHPELGFCNHFIPQSLASRPLEADKPLSSVPVARTDSG